MQWKAAIWILGAICTFPTLSIEAITGLIPIHSHLQKISSKYQLRIQPLPSNYILKSMLELIYLDNNSYHCLSLKKFTPKQQESIIDANDRLNRVFPSFISFSSKFLPGNRLIDIYPSYFSFHSTNKHKKSRQTYIQKLNNLTLQVLDNLKMAIVVSNASIKKISNYFNCPYLCPW